MIAVPVKSKAQLRWMFWAEAHGKLPPGTAERWAHETPNIEDLPEKKARKREAIRRKLAEKKRRK